jgi:nitrite reductase (NO-forming)
MKVRGRSQLRDWPVAGWLAAAVVVAAIHRWIPDAVWLMLHLVFLGAMTHAVMVWSTYFAKALLKVPDRPGLTARLLLVAAGSAMVLVGVPTAWWPLTLAGAIVVVAAVVWHGLALWSMMRTCLPGRFRVTIRYYIAAAACLAVGASFGATLAFGWEDPWHGRFLVAHALTNVLGWLGLTATGTLLTLWPTMLRTRMDPAADGWTRRAMPVLIAGIVVSSGGALLGWSWLSASGLVVYLGGLALWGAGMWRPLRGKPLTEFAPASVAAAMVWFVIGIAWAGWVLVTSADWTAISEAFVWPAAALGAGFAVQLVTGALSYLLPSVLGGGPSVVRAGQWWFNAGAGFRLVAINGGLIAWLTPTPSWVKVTGSTLALGAAVAFLPLMLAGIRASIVAKRAIEGGEAPADDERTRPPVFSAGQLIAGVTALATAVVLGVGLDPALGTTQAHGGGHQVVATGDVVRVAVEVRGMHYYPSSVTIRPGDQLVVELTNSDSQSHDLVIGTARTARIGPGKTAELDAGVIGESVQGYCSIAGHRQMGMVFDVLVEGGAAPGPAEPSTGSHPHPTTPQDPPPLEGIIDPVLPPLGDEKVRKVTLTAQEVTLEVAPGVWQKRWTFNGRTPGPTLHGRVGDVFEVTLVNDGSMGHSIDFHAGALAPDRPMRTIEPGESLEYRFTAGRAGIWMYHCSTMPMTAHIGAGMFGAVVIEPEGLPAVDRSYVLVQSETYLQTVATKPEDATEVNADAVNAEQPTYMSFNGIAFGYDQQPLTARVGERVRFWVLAVGPNRPTSFHIVGAQFDTVFFEGGYLLRRGSDAFGTKNGGSQALGLQAAQGGFVETVFPEAGRYTFVNHSMVDAERGAHGFVVVK